MEFGTVAEAVAGTPFMDRWPARRIYDHLRASRARDVLELGTAHGVSAAYMAAAVAERGGRVTTVDRYRFEAPTPEALLARAGLADAVELVRVPHSSYTWWLKEVVERNTGPDGACTPVYDFCLIDGAHDWHVDGLAAVLVERLLRPGGWMVFDDLDWVDDRGTGMPNPGLSDAERGARHVRAVFDVIVKPHPAFAEFVEYDGQWGWARKRRADEQGERTATLRTTRRESSILEQRVELLLGRARSALRGSRSPTGRRP